MTVYHELLIIYYQFEKGWLFFKSVISRLFEVLYLKYIVRRTLK